MEKKSELTNFFDDAFVIVSTTKPIMGIKYAIEYDEYQIVYMTQDKLLKKDKKNLFIKEYLGGVTKKYLISQFLSNEISVFNFLESLSEKKRVVQANSKIFPSKNIETMTYYSKYLPRDIVFLNNMPACSNKPILSLKKIINYEIELEKIFNIKVVHRDLNEDRSNYTLSKLIKTSEIHLEESEPLINETIKNKIQTDTYDEIKSIPFGY